MEESRVPRAAGRNPSILRTIHFQGYRSLRDFRLRLGQVMLVTGENAVEKPTVYRAPCLMKKMPSLPPPIHAMEFMLREVRDRAHYPALIAARETLL